MKDLDVVSQSKNAYNQWKDIWRKHANDHKAFAPFKPLSDFMNHGVGRALILVANGASFEKQIEDLKANREGHDVMCCDKTLGSLLDNGIVPDFCLVCDAMVDYEKYMKPWEDKLQGTTLFMNVCGNSQWSKAGNWKDRYFFVNFDVIQTEKEFCGISGCENLIPAGTNVSNAMVVFVTQSDNTGRRNFFGYDKLLLLGFDYSWMPGGSYYAFDKTGGGKHNYMRHAYAVNRDGEMVFTSGNLLFSAQWLEKYLSTFHLPAVNCSIGGLLGKIPLKPLAKQIPYRYKPEDRDIVKIGVSRRHKLLEEVSAIENRMKKIGEEHWQSYVRSTL